MNGSAISVFVKEILPLLLVGAALCLAQIWIPWRRLIWIPKDAQKVEEEVRKLLARGNGEEAIDRFQKSYGLSREHAIAIVDTLREKKG